MQFNSNFEYDLKIGNIGENLLAEILSNKKVEVKYDQKAKDTGNLYVELWSRGKWSGISTTKAEYVAFVVEGTGLIIIFETTKLHKLIKIIIKENTLVKGGDSNTSQGVLLKLNKMGYYNSLLKG